MHAGVDGSTTRTHRGLLAQEAGIPMLCTSVHLMHLRDITFPARHMSWTAETSHVKHWQHSGAQQVLALAQP